MSKSVLARMRAQGSIERARVRLRNVQVGDRVEVAGLGEGAVGYVRVYGGQIEAISVVLDSQADRSGYAGTPCFPETVYPIVKEEI